MNGITIITEHFCRTVELRELIISGAFTTLLICFGLFVYGFMYKNKGTSKSVKHLIIFCSALLVSAYIWFWTDQINRYNETHMEYTITIDDSVSFNDFYKKYEIVSVNGDKYRVVEK